ncbi:MAG TPA: hypothetical protein VGP17_05370 [Solirubrobacteraceae bacterium]|nr:hypothetical protein [Solirubrobacteraceae bacterium]
MESQPGHDPFRAALARARSREARHIRNCLLADQVLGVFGEAEVGKTQTIRQALGGSAMRVLRLDLRWAASYEHLGFLLACEMARTLAPGFAPSSLAYGGRLPAAVEQARSRLVETLGGGLQEAMRLWPSGRYDWPVALESLELLAQAEEALLWVDHLEAPRLSFRHPLKLAPLLWSISELVERAPNLRLLLSGREAARAEVEAPRAAFSDRGRWLSLHAPSADAWCQVAELVDAGSALVAELVDMTAGHPRTMLLALASVAGQPAPPPAQEVLLALAEHDDGLAARAMEHARSLHRLGGQALTQAALGQRPYATAQRGTTTTQELSKALKRLRLAGLLRHEDSWRVVNPLLAMRLRAASAPESPTSVRPPWS